MNGSQNDSYLPSGFFRGSMKVRPPGDLPRESPFAKRVLTACKTIRALPDREARFLGTRPLQNSIWREAVQDWWECYNDESEKDRLERAALELERFRPTRGQIDDCFLVLGWCAPLDKKSVGIIFLRSLGLSFTKIAGAMKIAGSGKMSHDTAQRRYNWAIDEVFRNSIITR